MKNELTTFRHRSWFCHSISSLLFCLASLVIPQIAFGTLTVRVYNATTNYTDTMALRMLPYPSGSVQVGGTPTTIPPGGYYDFINPGLVGTYSFSTYFQNNIGYGDKRPSPSDINPVRSVAGETYFVIVSIYDNTNQQNQYCVPITCQNTGLKQCYAYYRINGVYGGFQLVQAGASYTYPSVCLSDGDVVEYGVECLTASFSADPLTGEMSLNYQTNNLNSGSGYAQTNGMFASTNITSYPSNALSWTNYNAGGGINYSGTSSTAARDDTLKAGFGALNSGLDRVVDGMVAIKQSVDGISGGGGTNNISINITNDALTLTELTNLINGYQNEVTNTTIMSGTNAGDTIVSSWTSMNPSDFGSFSASDSTDFTFSLGTLPGLDDEIVIDSSLIPNPNIFEKTRTLAKWFIYAITLFAMFKWSEDALSRALAQRQMGGSQQALFGFNASVPSALAYVTITSSLIASIPLGLFVAMAGTGSILSGASGGLADAATTIGWNIANFVIPTAYLISGFLTYCSYRFIYGVPLLLLIRTVILWMVR